MNSKLDERVVKELKETFDNHLDNTGKFNIELLGELSRELGEALPNYKLRELMNEFDKNKDGFISFEEFLDMFENSEFSKAWAAKLRQNISTKTGVVTTRVSEKSAEGTVHSMIETEKFAFSNYLNRLLKGDQHVAPMLPIKSDKYDLFKKLGDGIILCKMVNLAVPNTIDPRTISVSKLNKYNIVENLNLALNSCRAIGIHVVNVSAEDIIEGTPHLVLGLVWQILKLVLFSKITLKECPNLAVLLREGETIQFLMSLPPEEILIRWVNYHMEKNNCNRIMTNYTSDLKDSEIYANLAERVLPEKPTHSVNQIMSVSDIKQRAVKTVKNYDDADLAFLLTAADIHEGHQKLNLAFLAYLFNLYPSLEEPEEPVEIIEETREEKMYRNWMNSLGVNPKVNYLYKDLTDGLVFLQLLEIIKKGSVDWKRVNKHPMKPEARIPLLKLENCNYVVDIAKSFKFSLVGIGGDDLATAVPKLTLSVCFQMMKAYILGMLQELTPNKTPVTDDQIVSWANNKCSTQIKSFKDQTITTSKPIVDLINSIKPNAVNTSLLNGGKNAEEKMQNAMLAISSARKIGAVVIALPEDIAEGQFKMIMTIYASLMIRDLKGN